MTLNQKRISFTLVATICLFALVAFALPGGVTNIDNGARWMRSGFFATNVDTQVVAANRVSKMLAASSVIDVATATAACNDSAGVTITGAAVGDPCFVGAPTTITGAGTGLSASFTCYVSAANTVVLRHCVAGVAADDPASATWFFRVISSQ